MEKLPLLRTFLKKERVVTANLVFQLHGTATVVMLLVFTLMVTSKQFFGEPIHCMGDNYDGHNEDKDAIDSYCLIYGTYEFTLKSRLTGISGKHNIYPGVGPHVQDSDEQIKHTYYQWVCFVLLGQAVMFYMPNRLWKLCEGGRLEALVANLGSPMITKEWSEVRRGELVAYMSYPDHYTHLMYALHYACCEMLNLLNVVGQIFVLDGFLGGAFRNYASTAVAFLHISRVPPGNMDYTAVNPMDQVFPKLTKCWFRNYGPSGSPQFKDRLCVLPVNIVNEFFFIIVWFWFITLACLSLLAVLFRVLVLTFAPLRTAMIMGQLRDMDKRVVSRIVMHYPIGDWFILYLLGQNMNPIIYKEFILELSMELENMSDSNSIIV